LSETESEDNMYGGGFSTDGISKVIYFYVELIFSYIFHIKLAKCYVKTSTTNRPSYDMVT